MRRRRLALPLLVAVPALAALAGCGGGNDALQSRTFTVRVAAGWDVGSLTWVLDHDVALTIVDVREPVGGCNTGSTEPGLISSACVFDPRVDPTTVRWEIDVEADADPATLLGELRCWTFTHPPPDPGSVGRETWDLDCVLE